MNDAAENQHAPPLKRGEMSDATSPAPPAGPAVDARGVPVIDPTANVLALVGEAVRRQDDLRAAADAHVREIAELRAQFEKDMRIAESARIDAIRAVDVGAVSRAAEVSATQAQTLAVQVATSAEAMRAQVAAAATAAATALATALEPMRASIEDLRRAQYEQQGQRVAQTEGKHDGGQLIGWAIAAIAVVANIALGIALILHK